MAIACAYCGGTHDAPAAVRECWERGGRQDVPLGDGDQPVDHTPISSRQSAPSAGSDAATRRERVAAQRAPRSTPPTSPRSTPPTSPRSAPPTSPRSAPPTSPRSGRHAARRVVERGVALATAGPDGLGRHLVVTPGSIIPEPWTSCSRIVVDDGVLGDPHAVLAELRRAHHSGERMVIELAAEFEQRPRETTRLAPFELGPRFAFDLDELHHLVWTNSVDGRGDRPTWHALDLAIAVGGRPVAPGVAGDVTTPDGTAVWIDGGPVRLREPIDGVPVLHVVAVEHGSWRTPLGNETDAELAPDQLAAVTHPGGGARIIAPAGSGKTRVLTERARHLLTRWQLPDTAISLVAFNKRAQTEMQERTADLPNLHVRTLNSIALAIVNGTAPFAPQPRSWRTIDEPDVRRIIGDLVRFPRRRNSDPIAPWIEALASVRLGLLTPDDVEAGEDGDLEGFAAMWPRYRAVLERQGAVDFDDQIHRALLVLLTDADARDAAQAACRVMLVDEFQDLTPAHLLLVRLLAAPGGAVFGVGDDDQTIYGYNGADPAWLIGFADLFAGAGDHPLEVNYRCPGGVVDAVDRLLRHNTRRVAKTIRSASNEVGGWAVDARPDAVTATVEAVDAAFAAGAAPADVAVLARVNAVLAPVQVALVHRGVPVAGGVGTEFLDRTAVGSVLAWIRLAIAGEGPFLEADLREALRRPSRSFHPRIADWIAEQRSAVDLHRLAARLNKERDSERVAEFAEDIQTLRRRVESGATTSDVILALIDEIGLASAVATLDSTRRGMNRASQGDDLTAVTQLAALHDDPRSFERWLRSQLAVRRDASGVVLSTVHRVKGQEWPHVVVHFADREQYPHRLADDVEEERRLFHVALTRARVHATVVTGTTPSPFVDELTTEPDPAALRTVAAHRPATSTSTTSRRASSTTEPTTALDPDAKQRYLALPRPAQRTARRQAGVRRVRQPHAGGDRPSGAGDAGRAGTHPGDRPGQAGEVRRRGARGPEPGFRGVNSGVKSGVNGGCEVRCELGCELGCELRCSPVGGPRDGYGVAMTEAVSTTTEPVSYLSLPRPVWRGKTHAWAFFAAIPAAILLIIAADGGRATAGAAIYSASLLALFGSSAAYHRLAQSPRARVVMQRVDHSMIYLLIAGTYVPLCLVAMPPSWGIPMLAIIGVMAIAGVVMKILLFDRAQWISAALYLVMGWTAIIAAPVLVDHLTGTQLALIVAGGVAYTAGFPVLFTRRPNPWPTTFGYHEIWHLFVVVAAGLHFAAVTDLVV